MEDFWESLKQTFDTSQLDTESITEALDLSTSEWIPPMNTALCYTGSAVGIITVLALVVYLFKALRNKSCCFKKQKVEEVLPKLVKFSYKWTIHDFLCCDLLSGADHIDSAEFSPPGFGNERFSLRIQPRAGKEGKDVSLYVRYHSIPVPAPTAEPAVTDDKSKTEEEPKKSDEKQQTQPVDKTAQIQFACSILGTTLGLCGQTKTLSQEIKADIKSGESSGWLAFVSRENLLNSGISYQTDKALAIYFEGCYIATK